MSVKQVILAAVLVTAFCAQGARAHAFSCSGGVISEGDAKAEVLLKCGEPAGRESREEETLERIDEAFKRKTTITIDEWTYNFGPRQFLRILEFRGGRLSSIRTGGYGYDSTAGPAADCEALHAVTDATKVDVRARCGEPAWKEERTEELIETVDENEKRKTTVHIEEWTYNLGPDRFMRIFTFRNSRLADIRTGGYGR